MMSDVTLTEFLLARIAEDEAAARLAGELAETPWRATYGRQVETARDGYLVTPEDEHSYTTDPPDEVGVHIARHDPARVLAECEAKRRIIAYHQADGEIVQRVKGLRPTVGTTAILEYLAVVYADHKDYREEWRP